MADPGPSSSLDTGAYQTQFVPHSDDDETLWAVDEILQERNNRYKVKWAGTDPKTGKPWPDSWVRKQDCTDVLIREWKAKNARKKNGRGSRTKSGSTNARGSTASSKTTNRTGSASTTATTRRTRQSLTKLSTPPTSTRPVSKASPIRASPSISPEYPPLPQKRRKATHEDPSEDSEAAVAGPSRQRKKRKISVEVVRHSELQDSGEPQSSYEVVARKKFGKTAVSRTDEEGERDDAWERKPSDEFVQGRSVVAAGKRKAMTPELEGEGDEGLVGPVPRTPVPVTKVGPPRHLKRRRKDAQTSHASSARDDRPPEPPATLNPSIDHKNGRSTSAARSHVSLDGETRPKDTTQARTARLAIGSSNGAASKVASTSRGATGRPRPSRKTDKNTVELDLGGPAATLQRALSSTGVKSSLLSERVHQLLMVELREEEEEDSQEAAGPPPAPVVQSPNPTYIPGPLLDLLSRRPGGSPTRARERQPESDPPKRAPLRARQFANDTFSREGIVPETQVTEATDALDEPPYNPTQEDLVTTVDIPRTPIRSRTAEQLTAPLSTPSVISRMKNKQGAKLRGLRPIPYLSQSAFHPYLPPADEDDIEQFSSPEKHGHKVKGVPKPFTQDTIEDESTQDMADSYVDWEGGAQPQEPSASMQENGPDLSLGPDLPPPDSQGHVRSTMDSILSKEDIGQMNAHSSDTGGLQEPPPTSTTQQADADSQSQQPSILSVQIAELNGVLEEKDEKLTQLEGQIEELQTRISELETENAENRSSLDAELNALREASGEKAEQISLLESQLVELQLQLTQLTTDSDDQRVRYKSQIREMSETLEERNEQLSQLEAALVELQVEIEAMEAENEKLAAAFEQRSTRVEPDPHVAEELAAQQARLTSLEEELASAREKLFQAEQEATSLSAHAQVGSEEQERRLKHAEDDRELFKRLYTEASEHAQRPAKENADLEERAQRAEGQASLGVATVRGMFTAQVKALQAEVERWKGTCKVLTDRDARTDDEVRMRAARELGLQEENERLRREVGIARRDAVKMAAVIEQMSSVGRKVDEDEEADEDFVPDPDDDDDEDSGSTSSSSSSSSSRDGSGSVSPSARSDARGVRYHSPSVDESEEFFVCQYVSGAVMCNETFPTAQNAVYHAYITHYQDLDMMQA